MNWNPRSARIAFLALVVVACGGGGSPTAVPPAPPPPPPPPPTNTLSGFVFDLENDATVAGATVTAGNVSTTSGADGRFTLSGVPAASVIVGVAAAGYDTVTESVDVRQGSNLFSKWIPRVNTMYENDGYLIYIPSGIATVRGVFVPALGGGTDGRKLVREELSYFVAFQPYPGDIGGYRQRMAAFARANGLAILGARFFGSDGETTAAIDAIAKASVQSNRPELALAPFLLHGHSTGACTAFNWAVGRPERVIGFIVTKGLCPPNDASPANKVPGYLIYNAADDVDPAAAATMISTFSQYRARGANWALAREPGTGHNQVADQVMLFNWLQDVLTQRLPSTPTAGSPVVLRDVTPNSGWLGNGISQVIGEYACYTGDKLSASWLPSEKTARDWQAFASSRTTTAIQSCPP